MIQGEYVRDIHNHYLVLKGNENTEKYGIKMLLNNKIQGILTMELRCIDEMDLYYYNITSKKTLKSIYENKSLIYHEIKELLYTILNIVEICEEYLLSEHDFIIDPNYIYIDNELHSTELCHLVGYNINIKLQISDFIEYLMNKVDYKDEQAVLLVYTMYKESKEEGCTLDQLKKELNKKIEEGLYNKQKDKIHGMPSSQKCDKEIIINNTMEKQAIKYENVMNRQLKNKQVMNKQVINKQVKNKQVKNKQVMNKQAKNKQVMNKQQDYSNEVFKNNTSKSLFVNIRESIYNKIIFRILNHGRQQNNSLTDIKKDSKLNIPIDMDQEKEVYYFQKSKYIIGCISIMVCIGLMLLTLYFDLLDTKFGSIDYTKLICFIVMIVCVEAYILTKLFDKNSRLTKIVRSIEYLKDNNEYYDSYMTPDSLSFKEDETQILNHLNKENEMDCDKTTVLSEISIRKKYFLVPCETCNSEEGMRHVKIPILNFPFFIGKTNNQVDLCIPDSSVSRIHAKLIIKGDAVVLVDLKSTNGTFVNGIQLSEEEPYTLKQGDVFSISKISYQWYMEEYK